jgi:hypothetical protein
MATSRGLSSGHNAITKCGILVLKSDHYLNVIP